MFGAQLVSREYSKRWWRRNLSCSKCTILPGGRASPRPMMRTGQEGSRRCIPTPMRCHAGLADGALSASALAQRSTSQLFPPKLGDVDTSKIDWTGVTIVEDFDEHHSGGQ
jgi:hypothetical protein